VNVLRIGIARAAAVSCRRALRNETAGIDLTRRLRLSLSDRVSRRHYRQSEDGQQSPSRDACIHFNRPPCLFVMNAGAYRSIKSGKHSRLLVGLDPLIRRQRSVADDGAERDDRRRETQQPNRNRAILTFVFECARRRGPHACLLTAFRMVSLHPDAFTLWPGHQGSLCRAGRDTSQAAPSRAHRIRRQT
jgi:hypothetical protein